MNLLIAHRMLNCFCGHETNFNYIFCLQLQKVKYGFHATQEAMHNNYLFNHTAYHHMFQQVISFHVIF